MRVVPGDLCCVNPTVVNRRDISHPVVFPLRDDLGARIENFYVRLAWNDLILVLRVRGPNKHCRPTVTFVVNGVIQTCLLEIEDYLKRVQ